METEEINVLLVDWDRVELAYRSGILPEQTICDQYNISRKQLDDVVTSRGWTRTILTPEDEATVLAIAEEPRFPCDSLFSANDVKRKALMTAGEIVRLHRKDVGRMRGVASQIMERLEQFMVDGDMTLLFSFLGKNDSATDLLSKLSNILTKVVTIEREAYGLSNLVIDNDEEAQSELASSIRELSDRLKLITEQKAQKVELIEEKKDASIS